MKLIDIVIPSAGRAADLLRLLESLREHCANTWEDAVQSITVTDDRHSLAIAQQVAAAHPNVDYVAGPARGPAANRNNGAARGQAPWILFLDDDCYVQEDLIRAYTCCMAAVPAANVIEGAIHPVGSRPNGNHHAPINPSGGYLWSCNLMIRRDLFDVVGRFDEQFPFACMEDVDLAQRLKSSAAVIAFARDAVVLHPWRSISERELQRQIISHAIYAQKHPEFVRGWTFMQMLRMVKGRAHLYGLGGFSTIPSAKYRTVCFDLVAPVALLAVTRVPPLRRSVWNRYRNRQASPLLTARS